MSNYAKFLTALMALAVMAASVRHYGGGHALNEGYTLGCLGYETAGDPGWFTDCGDTEVPQSAK